MTTTRSIVALTWFVLLCVASAAGGTAALKMDVSPAISRAPAKVQVRVLVNAGPDDRELHVVAESASYFRSSDVQLEGTSSGALNVFEFRDLPAGTYQITGVLIDGRGPRAKVSRFLKVEPGFGGSN